MNRFLLIILIAIQFGCAADQGGSGENAALACGPTRGDQQNATSASQEDDNVNRLNLNSNAQLSANFSQFKNFIVKFKNKVSSATALGLQPSGNAIGEYQVKGLSLRAMGEESFTFELNSSSEEKKRILDDLLVDADIDYVEPDYPVYPIDATPGVAGLNQTETEDGETVSAQATSQWALNTVHSDEAWKITKGSKDLLVAVLDSGIDYNHKDLKANMWTNKGEVINGKDDDRNGYIDDIYGWNFASNNSNAKTTSASNHGTHVAGIIGGTGSTISGLSPKVKLMALKFIDESGTGSTSAAIKGIDYAIKKGVFAINNSWGSTGNSRALSDAITRAEKAGILFVVAAGNGNRGVGYNIDRTPWYPAAYTNSNILTVAATMTNDQLTSFSNYGLNKVDVAAPGLQILSTVTNNNYQKMSGTSMAAPLVTGLSVLVKAANPALSYKQIINIIRGSVDRISSMVGRVGSGGRVNAQRAVRVAAEAGSSPSASIGINCP